MYKRFAVYKESKCHLSAVLGRTSLEEGAEMVETFLPVYDSEILES